jgi:hypothetical protein
MVESKRKFLKIGVAGSVAFLAGCGPKLLNPTQTPLPSDLSPTRTSSPLPASATPSLSFTETPTKTIEPTLNPYALFSPFEKSSFSPEMQTYLADLPGRQVAETGSKQEDDYIKKDQAFHLYYTQGLIDFLVKEGVDVSSFKNTDLLVYNNSIKVYEAFWKQIAKNPESYDTKWIPTPWLLRGDGKTNLGMYDPANLIILPSDKRGQGKYNVWNGSSLSTDDLINKYDPVGHNWETAKNKWFDAMRNLYGDPNIPILGIDAPRICLKDYVTYGVLTALADHPGYPDGSVKTIFLGFQDNNGEWVYQPFAVNLGKNSVKSGDYIYDRDHGQVYPLGVSKDQFPIPVVGSGAPTKLGRNGYTLADLIGMIDHQVYGSPYNAFVSSPNHYIVFEQYFFDGIESFGYIYDGDKATISPLSPATGTPTLTPFVP